MRKLPDLQQFSVIFFKLFYFYFFVILYFFVFSGEFWSFNELWWFKKVTVLMSATR